MSTESNCLLCFEKVQIDLNKEANPENLDNIYGDLEVNIPKICEVLSLSSSAFSVEEYANFKAPVCSECDSTIKRIAGLLEDLKRIETNLLTLRLGIQSQLSGSIQRNGNKENEEQEILTENQTSFEAIRQKIVTSLTAESSENNERIKDEPLPYHSEYEDENSTTDFNIDGDSLLDQLEQTNVLDNSLPEVKIKRKPKKEATLKQKKSVKKMYTSKRLPKKEKKKPGRKKKVAFKVEELDVEDTGADENQLFSGDQNVSRSGRLRRSTTKPDFLYKGGNKKSVYIEDDESDDNEESSGRVKLEGSDKNDDYFDQLDDIQPENFSDSDVDSANDKGKRKNSASENENVDNSDYNSDVKPPKIRKTRRSSTKRVKKTKVKKPAGYKHIIDPDLTEAHIRLIGSNKKPMESSRADMLIVSKNGKKSLDMNTLVTDDSIAVLQINEQLYGKRFSCTQEGCRKTFTDKESRDIHVRRKHEKNPFPFVCETCGKAFRQLRTLKRHNELNCQDDNMPHTPRRRKAQVKHKSHLCQYCPEKYRSPSELQIHVRKAHTGETPYKCQYCEQSFISALKLEHHTEQNHDEVAPIKCEYCAKGFFREHRLKIHVVVHTGERPYLCEICCKSFALKNQLTYHQTMHNEQLAYKFRCSECNKNFASPQNLKQHVKSVHERSYRYICQVCNHGSAQMSTHRVHMRTHTGEKPFRCHFCEKAYINGSMLKIHLRNHTGERPYVCNVCQKGFTVKSKLDRHVLLHKEERPFQCTLCPKGFTTVSYLNSHYKSSHKQQVLTKELHEVIPIEILPTAIAVSLPTSMPVTLPTTIPVTLQTSNSESIPTTISVTLPLSDALPVSLQGQMPIHTIFTTVSHSTS